MYVKSLQLSNFRNYDKLHINFSKNTNVFIGDNAQGKTNILESIYYSSIGKSHRTSKDKELIKWDKNNSHISVYVDKKRLDKIIDIKILDSGKKAISINSIKIKKISELIGILNVVIFSPEDLKIIKESPSYRRRFLDLEICKLNKKYYYSLVQYNKILSERNSILKSSNKHCLQMLDVYDAQLAQFGTYIVNCRNNYIDKLNLYAKVIHKKITNGLESIEFKYISKVSDINNANNELLNIFTENREKDFLRRVTTEGPHRDDFLVEINGVNTRIFGSQGQQRTCVLTLKFASLEIIKESIGEYPVLLLDDVLSELDSNRQKFVLNSIHDIQTIITCTGIEEISKYIDENSKIFTIEKGNIRI